MEEGWKQQNANEKLIKTDSEMEDESESIVIIDIKFMRDINWHIKKYVAMTS